MYLLDLPIELFRKVLEQTVVTVALTNAAKLRRVCKIFASEIPLAMLNAGLLEIEHRKLHFVPNNTWLVIEHIFRKTQAYDCGIKNLPAAIRQASCVLVTEDNANYHVNREDCVRKLSEAAAWKMSTRSIVHYLKSESEGSAGWGRHFSLSNHLVSAAAYLGDLPFFKRLRKAGEIESPEDVYFGNPLRCAVYRGHYELTKFLLDNGVDVNQAEYGSGFGLTALQTAAFTGKENFIRLLLDDKYKCCTLGKDYDDAILRAASGGNLAIVKLLIGHVNMTATEDLYSNILLAAAGTGREEVVRFALQNGADPNWKFRSCDVIITAAARHGYHNVVKVLLEHGASINFSGRQGTLNRAVRSGYWRTLQVLVDSGIDPNHPYLSELERAAVLQIMESTTEGPIGRNPLPHELH